MGAVKIVTLIVAGHLWLAPPHRAPVRAAHAEVAVFNSRGVFVSALRTGRDGSFRLRLHVNDYFFRVRPTARPFCHITALRIERPLHSMRIRIPTNKEHKCADSHQS